MSALNFHALKSFDGSVNEREFNALVDVIQSITLNPGRGYTLSRNAAGTVITTTPGKGGASSQQPFQMLLAAGETEGTKTLTFVPGTMNSLLPSNIFDEFTVADTGIIKVKVRGTSNGEAITSVALVVDGSEAEAQTPTPNGLPLAVDILVGVIVDGVAFRVIGDGSLILTGKLQYTVDKEGPPAIGERPYVPYYAWIQEANE